MRGKYRRPKGIDVLNDEEAIRNIFHPKQKKGARDYGDRMAQFFLDMAELWENASRGDSDARMDIGYRIICNREGRPVAIKFEGAVLTAAEKVLHPDEDDDVFARDCERFRKKQSREGDE